MPTASELIEDAALSSEAFREHLADLKQELALMEGDEWRRVSRAIQNTDRRLKAVDPWLYARERLQAAWRNVSEALDAVS